MNDMWSGIITIASAIVGIAILAVLVGSNSQTANVIRAAGSAFANDLSAAEAPVLGGSMFGGMPLSGGANSVYVQ